MAHSDSVLESKSDRQSRQPQQVHHVGSSLGSVCPVPTDQEQHPIACALRRGVTFPAPQRLKVLHHGSD